MRCTQLEIGVAMALYNHEADRRTVAVNAWADLDEYERRYWIRAARAAVKEYETITKAMK
jgi:hypothetical protein